MCLWMDAFVYLCFCGFMEIWNYVIVCSHNSIFPQIHLLRYQSNSQFDTLTPQATSSGFRPSLSTYTHPR